MMILLLTSQESPVCHLLILEIEIKTFCIIFTGSYLELEINARLVPILSLRFFASLTGKGGGGLTQKR